MGDSTCKRTNSLHFLGLSNLIFKKKVLGNITLNCYITDYIVIIIFYRCNSCIFLIDFTVFFPVGKGSPPNITF